MVYLKDLTKDGGKWSQIGIRPVERVFFSSYVKDDPFFDFATFLAERGAEIVSSGGTADKLKNVANLKVITSEELTGLRSILDHRVATLHPKIHGGILCQRDNPKHQADMAEYGIEPFDLVCVNIYPFIEAIGKGELTEEEMTEMIDIGGPTLLRGAAKNCVDVCAVSDPAQYTLVKHAIEEIGGTNLQLRVGLSEEVYGMMSKYDAAVAKFRAKQYQSLINPQS